MAELQLRLPGNMSRRRCRWFTRPHPASVEANGKTPENAPLKDSICASYIYEAIIAIWIRLRSQR